MTYNLCDEPWIQVRGPSGATESVSIRSIFARATELSGLAGELATQDAAVLRVLLAIVLRATRDYEGEPLDVWAKWWRDGLPLEEIEHYLDDWHRRFDLRDPEMPFFQVAKLTTASGKASGLGKIVADLPDGEQFFTTRAGAGLESLSAAEAARWLVHCQAFDPSGIKSGAVGDERVKGGKGYPQGTGWAGNLGLVIVEGDSLDKTLLLNLDLRKRDPEDDRPAWERPPLTSAVEVGHESPRGPADVFTWQARRIRLLWQGDRVTDVQISYGDRLDPQNRFEFEPMSAFRHSQNQTQKARGMTVYMPTTHDPARQVWRGLAGLLTNVKGSSIRPASLEWLAELVIERVLDTATAVRLRAVGVSYGTQSAVIDGAVDDPLSCRIANLVDEQLIGEAITAAAAAQSGVAALAGLAGDLAKAANADAAGPRQRAWEAGFAALDIPYREWLGNLSKDGKPSQLVWSRTAFRILLKEGERLEQAAGPNVLTGRNVNRPGEKSNHMDLGRAGVFFRAALAKALPDPSESFDQEAES